jgi:hypothetical protein
MRRWVGLFAVSLAACVPALGADRGIAVKQPAEVGLGEYEPERCHALVIVLQFLKYSDAPAFGVQDLYVYVRKPLIGLLKWCTSG